MKKIILDLCGGTGSWSNPYSENNYIVKIITLPDFDISKKEVQKFCISLKPYGILAAPPCTMFSLARNDKTAKEPRNMRQAMEVVDSCLNIIRECYFDRWRNNDCYLKFWALENPHTGYLKKFLGNPPLVFNPCDYGDPYTKKTSIWGYFNIPKKNPVKPIDFEHPTTKGAKDFVSCVEHYAHMKNIPTGYLEKTGYSKRTILRSMTPCGFANAFFKANK